MPQKLLRAPQRKINVKRGNGHAKARLITNKRNDHSSPYMGMVRQDTRKLQLMDPFVGFYSQSDEIAVIEPRLPFWQLVQVGKQNSALNQCIDAYVVNIESYGYQLEYVGPVGKENSTKAKAEKDLAISFLDHPNGEKSLRVLREDSRKDLEYVGNRFFEIGRDIAGRITWMDHVPAVTMRKTRKDKEATKYTTAVRGPDGKIYQKEWSKNFCRYVQLGAGGKKRFFKEFGDPRAIDPDTGKVNPALPVEQQASEIYHHALYSVGEAYGMPRWLGALPAMLGLRESELVNLDFFRENAIPAMAVLISGGALTEESFDKVSALFNGKRGREAMNKILILEAAADDSVGNADQAPPVPRIDMKPMISERQSDGLFKDFEDSAKRKVRSSMRLPALYTGDTEEYTKATAQSGKQMAESQVFYPERSIFDDFVNMRVLPTFGITQWRFKTMGPTVYDPESLGTLIDRFARHGAMTPNIIIKIANQVLDVQIPSVTEEWGDIPFTYTMGMVNAGSQVEGLEDIFAVINDATGEALQTTPTDTGDGTAPAKPANDNIAAQRRAMRRLIQRELHAVSNDIINRINETMPLAA